VAPFAIFVPMQRGRHREIPGRHVNLYALAQFEFSRVPSLHFMGRRDHGGPPILVTHFGFQPRVQRAPLLGVRFTQRFLHYDAREIRAVE
jgi:hypothetical protein